MCCGGDQHHPSPPLIASCLHHDLTILTKTKTKALQRSTNINMKLSSSSILAFASMSSAVTAFNSFASKKGAAKVANTKSSSFTVENIPGALAPVGIFDPLGLAAKADANTLKRYREAELTHGRVAMLATVGFLAGEAVEGKSFLWDASVSGPAITHLSQIPFVFWPILTIILGRVELDRARIGWVAPEDVPVGQPGLLRDDYTPGDLGFDPLGLRPTDPAEFAIMQTKELQNGRLAMLAAAGFMAQELVDGKGIFDHAFLNIYNN
jgi:Chlorophyll A-B binding protein